MKVVDAHVHLGHWPEFDLSFTIRDLERMPLDGAVVMPALTGNPTKQNENLLDTVMARRRLYDATERGGPDLYPFVWVHPGEPLLMTWLQQRRERYMGLKFHASISQTSLVDPAMLDVLEFADEQRLPLLYHCGRNPISSAAYVKLVAPRYPYVTFIVAHMGGNAYDQIKKTMTLFGRSKDVPPNVYMDTSTARHPDLLARVFHFYGPDKILFGSDLPFTDPRMNDYCLRLAGLDRHEGVMGGNVLRLLKRR